MNDDRASSDLVQVGETGSAHGIDGEIRVFSAEPHWDYFQPGNVVHLSTRTGTDPYVLESWRVAEDFAIAKFESVDDRGEAERLTNLEVSVPADALPELEGRTFYHYNLEGREVFVPGDDGPRSIGVVEGIFETGANDVLVVRRAADDLYVPMFEGAIDEIRPEDDRILLHPPQQWASDPSDI